jgi:hypothetical protein
MELACDGHLYERMQGQKIFKEKSTGFVTRNLLEIVRYMHS